MNTRMITIFTPTYNRAYTLPKLYHSLQEQTCKDFEWLIVDDGSTDGTCNIIKDWENPNFEVRYFRKENGGKHTAINEGLKLAKGELFFIVDSDDVLTPDAVETIIKDWDTVKDKNLCGISYLRGYSETEVIGDSHPRDHYIDNFINVRFNQGIGGDKAEVWVTEYMRQHKYPVFNGEKFFGESWMWIKLSRERDMLWVNKIIYITKYLEGGLSLSGRALRITCPLGGMETAITGMDNRIIFSQRFKMALLYVAYGFFANKSTKELLNNPYKKLVLSAIPFGFMIYKIWKKQNS